MNLNILKDWRVLIWILALIFSLYLLMPTIGTGVIVKTVSTDSPLYEKVAPGELISWANEKDIKTAEEFYSFDNYTGVFRFMHSGKLEVVDISKPGLKVIVSEKPTSNLNLGMDLVGGTRVLLEPAEENVSSDIMIQALSTLETRINIYGLKETKFQIISDISGGNYIQIEMAGGSKEETEELLSKQGMFEGRIIKPVYMDEMKLILGDKNYTVELVGDSIKVDGKTIGMNESFTLDGIEILYLNKTEKTILLSAKVFQGSDIKSVCIQEQQGICVSRVYQQDKNSWEFVFQIFLSDEGANRFGKVTKGMKTLVDPNSGESYLDGQIVLFLDNMPISSLSIASNLQGNALRDPTITGGRETKQEVLKEKLKLQSILSSGSLPVKLNIVKVDEISPTLGQQFINSILVSALAAALGVGLIVFLKYRKIKIVIPMIFVSLSEVLIIIGCLILIKSTIDLSSLVGIIAVIGTGVDAQIMIIDEILMGGEKRKLYTMKQKIKKAFFIIFGSASTVIAAMIPLILIGIGVMRGFAITTILGVLIAILITRPAFGKIAERLLEKESSQ